MVRVLMERSDGVNAFVMAAELLRTSVWREWVGVKATAYLGEIVAAAIDRMDRQYLMVNYDGSGSC